MNIKRPMQPFYVPDFLYKYTSVARALEVLMTGEVYFSHRRELNDPFDGKQTIDISTRENREELIKLSNRKIKEQESQGRDLSHLLSGMDREEYQKRLTEDNDFANSQMQKLAEDMDDFNIGVYCFAEKRDSIVMWAHYANNHQGCCLEFNLQEHVSRSIKKGKNCFPFSVINMVRYSDIYPTHVFGEEGAPHEEKNSYMSKSEDWQYEKEWRAIMYDVKRLISGKSIGDEISDESIKRMEGSGHYPLDEHLLNGIVLGYKMKEHEKKSITNAARLHGIRVYEAKPKLYEYGMKIDLLR